MCDQAKNGKFKFNMLKNGKFNRYNFPTVVKIALRNY